jgi:hypothetical protein
VIEGESKPLATEMNLERHYLYVPPEEKAEVEALGARWDVRMSGDESFEV